MNDFHRRAGTGAAVGHSLRIAIVVALLAPLSACSTLQKAGDMLGVGGWFDSGSSPAITAAELLEHVQILASDAFGGRAPGTRGEDLTVAYLEEQFRKAGLEPGHPDGRYVQSVPLVGLRSDADLGIAVKGEPLPVQMHQDAMLISQRLEPRVALRDVPLVFAGYGVQAPEYGWDDYAGLDVRGKIVVMLVNDPQVRSADDRLDPRYFRGRAMTYYGRWTYKFEMASKLGAAGALVIHNTQQAGYPWEVVSGSWGTENFTLDRGDGNAQRVAVEGWLREDAARGLLEASGHSYDELLRAAATPGFRGIELPATASALVRNTVRRINSRNVVAAIPGTDPALRDEWVVYSAHWDHLGTNPALEGDSIYNGAVDNATGTGGLIEIAQALIAAPPRRSVLFLALTAEEQGLLGAKWYAEHPLYPLERTVANINLDGLNVWGPTEDVVVVGMGQSTLEDVLEAAAAEQGRRIRPEGTPEKGFYFRSDHFEFAKVGVPALFADSGITPRGGNQAQGEQQRADYVRHRYHKVSDEVQPNWNLAGAVQDLELMMRIGQQVGNTTERPRWKPGSEFAARR
ncbi:MAG: M28 family metallopeptidase [Oceanococcaceae bacterium]